MRYIGHMGNILFGQEGSVTWTLLNSFSFSSEKKKSCVTSPSFGLRSYTWCLTAIESRKYLGLFLWKLDSRSLSTEYEVKLGLKGYGEETKSFVGELDSYSRFGKWNFMLLETLHCRRECYSPNGFLDFFCEIYYKKERIQGYVLTPQITSDTTAASLSEGSFEAEEKEENDEPEVRGVDRLLQNLKTAFVEGQNSDMILKVENREFPVHKVILSVRSAVFASMLQHDMAEKNSGVVDIPDCSAEAFEVFLLYLYTGSADTMSQENVCNLYYIADKYGVDDLKEDAVDFMKSTLSVDTFCDVITLSLRHGVSELRQAATRFFCENVKKIIKTVQWQTYMQENTIQANELLIKALNA